MTGASEETEPLSIWFLNLLFSLSHRAIANRGPHLSWLAQVGQHMILIDRRASLVPGLVGGEAFQLGCVLLLHLLDIRHSQRSQWGPISGTPQQSTLACPCMMTHILSQACRTVHLCTQAPPLMPGQQPGQLCRSREGRNMPLAAKDTRCGL